MLCNRVYYCMAFCLLAAEKTEWAESIRVNLKFVIAGYGYSAQNNGLGITNKLVSMMKLCRAIKITLTKAARYHIIIRS